MGDSVENLYWRGLHRQSGDTKDIGGLRCHRDSTSVDVTLGSLTASEVDDLKAEAAISQPAFDAEAGSAWGSDYSNLSPAFRAAIRAEFNDFL